jgi:hypothetical protein
MKTKYKFLGLFAIAAFFLAGCASTAYIEKDDATDFSKYQTYSWIQKKDEQKSATAFADQKVRTAVNQELQKNGWREVTEKPDVLLGYDVLVERNTKEETEPVYTRPYTRIYYNPYTRRYGTIYYPSQFLGYDSYATPVKEGTLTLTIIDAQTDKTVWQGWTTGEVNSSKMTSKEIEAGVKSILRKLDVAKN